ncbi:hypothetical protein BO94DRAFT_216636 [Aspergillus sclerotioniger CBS 115572]|uniref:Uncharacterized protein n=1 Tax=Aspergillus sclerotioniger CBS 115572 TaxID=1450535 RepID=A0A317XDP1_9EURO|nr:hypothetical protein BO94DRAFT_216636 [Aspergillus sclerotioniger CBS 115572]PWY95038.1 hypothetical protein BO94DRAFT_216636 [Aspergillus sclerotioniger CBS 115572]
MGSMKQVLFIESSSISKQVNADLTVTTAVKIQRGLRSPARETVTKTDSRCLFPGTSVVSMKQCHFSEILQDSTLIVAVRVGIAFISIICTTWLVVTLPSTLIYITRGYVQVLGG